MYVTKHLNKHHFFISYVNIITKADRTEPYTRITPFQEKHDTSVESVVYLHIFSAATELIRTYSCKIFLQASDIVRVVRRFGRFGLCSHDSGCIGGRRRQETPVCASVCELMHSSAQETPHKVERTPL